MITSCIRRKKGLGKAMLSPPKLIPELDVDDLKRSLAFYTGTVGFRVLFSRREDRFAYLDLEGVHLMLGELVDRAATSPPHHSPIHMAAGSIFRSRSQMSTHSISGLWAAAFRADPANRALSTPRIISSLRNRTKAVRSSVASFDENPQNRRNDARSSTASANLMSDRLCHIAISKALNKARGGHAGSPLVAE